MVERYQEFLEPELLRTATKSSESEGSGVAGDGEREVVAVAGDENDI